MDKLRPLIDLLEEVFPTDALPKDCANVEGLLKDPKKCVEFMNNQLGTDMFTLHEEDKDFYQVAQCRARHSVITYLLGLVLAPFGNIIDIKQDDRQLWLKLSMYHDCGYFSEYVKNSAHDLRTGAKYYLFDDVYEKELSILNYWSTKHPEDCAFTYKEIEGYFEYSKKFHAKYNDKDEKVDHGVLGGVLVFHRLASKLLKSLKVVGSELFDIKKFCLAIAQHNMFRIKGGDKELAKDLGLERLYEENPFRINRDTPLLLFLSLIDTVECVKKFSKSENDSTYLQTETTLKSLELSVSKERIMIDCSKLQRAVEQKGKKGEPLEKAFNDYKNGLCKLNSWTVFQGEEIEKHAVTITLI